MNSRTIDLNPARWARVEELFAAAGELPAAERPAYLARACADDPELRRYVASLLDSGDAAGGIIEEPIRGVLPDAPAGDESTIGQQIGAYRIVRTIGQGGMGVVYLAERADRQFEHRVAVKLVRQRLLDPDVEARLRFERQVLANLDHPNIGRLFDGGTLGDGTPYLVMEYIDGIPIDEYCDRNRLTVTQRIDLFRKVCGAIHYAHQNLVVHRDIKPSNILVTADGVPKLLDFGIARVLDSEGESASELTRAGAVVLTPENAAPEQVRNEPLTTAVDTYALGVLLYRLLAGRAPYRIPVSRPADIPRIVCESVPPPPSQGVRHADDTTLGGEGLPGSASAIAAARRTTPRRLARQLAGDLDNIVMYALRKEPSRRYRSVNAFAQDLGRYLKSEPVAARPDTWAYRTSRFVRRHTASVSLAGALAVLLVAFAVMTVLQNRRIAEERDTAMQVASFLEEIFMEPDPGNARGASVTAREILEKGAARIASELDDRPSIQAALMNTIGRVYFNLGEYDQSIRMLEEALRVRRAEQGDNGPDVARVRNDLAATLTRAAEYERARGLLEEALAANRAQFGADSAEVALTEYNLAELHLAAGDPAAAERDARSSVAIFAGLGDEYAVELAESRGMLARVLQWRNELAEAEQLLRQALELVREQLGDDHPLRAYYTQNLAVVLQARGELDAAERMYGEAIDVTRKVLGEEHSLLGETLVMQGRLLHDREQYGPAEDAFRDALRVHRAARGESHPFVGYDLVSLGMLLHDTGRLAEAEEHMRHALDIYEASLGPEHQYIASALTELGAVLNDAGRGDEATPLLERAVAIRRKDYDDTQLLTASTLSVLGRNRALAGDLAAAETLLTGSVAVLESEAGAGDRRARRARLWLDTLAGRRAP